MIDTRTAGVPTPPSGDDRHRLERWVSLSDHAWGLAHSILCDREEAEDAVGPGQRVAGDRTHR